MSRPTVRFVFLCLLVSISGTANSVEAGSSNLVNKLRASKDLVVTKNTRFAANYEGTQCVDLTARKSKRNVGLICVSSNRRFVAEMGVEFFEAVPVASRTIEPPESGLGVLTPQGQYPMTKFGAGSFSAMVDCDQGNEPVYRATATCQVAVTHPEKDQILYGNFLVKDHPYPGGSGLAPAQIGAIWRMLEEH